RQVLIEFAAVGATQGLFQALRVAEDDVENALLVRLPALAASRIFLVVHRAEQALEHGARMRLRRIGRRRRAPREAVAVGAAVAVVAVAALQALLASDLEGPEACLP